jgi:hypothetical protein
MEPSNVIVDEVRAAREALARTSDDDLIKTVDAARQRQAENAHVVVTLPPRKAHVSQRAS